MHAKLRIVCWSLVAAASLACGSSIYKSVELNGYVRRSDGTPVAGVRMFAVWPDDPQLGSTETTTDANGRYRLFSMEPHSFDANWRHMLVTPSLAGFTFDPSSLDIFLADETQAADFTATATSGAQTVAETIWWHEPGGEAGRIRVVTLPGTGR